MALLLAALGIYSVISYSITLRTQEMDSHGAGCATPAILMMVFRTGMLLTLVGAALGLAGAFVLTRWMSSMLFGITASDPATYATVPRFAGCGAARMLDPARRATRVDPLVAFRYE